MANLSDKEKNDIIFYLGWPGKTLDEGSQLYSTIVNDRLINNSDSSLSITRSLLKRLKLIDQKLECALDRLSAKQVDTITLNPEEIRSLKSERTRNLRELSTLLDIAIVKPSGTNVGVIV